MRHGIGQSIRGKLVVDRTFAAPARVTASQIRFTVAVGIEQFGDLRIFQLRDVGDFVLVGSFLIDQVTLCRAVNKYSFTIKFLIATGSSYMLSCSGVQFTAVKVASPEASEV